MFDFHATRHNYISGIVAGGASAKTARELARHSTPTLTIGLHSRARLYDLQGIPGSLPSSTAEPRATGEAKSPILHKRGTWDAAISELSIPDKELWRRNRKPSSNPSARGFA